MPRVYISGCAAVAEAAYGANVQVIAAYPITPQTAIVEALAKKVADGLLEAKTIPVESEHSALSAVAGAALVGARTFTATSSQGLALMHEVLPYAAGLRLPIVMAVVNRSLASPVTIFCDHQDSLPERDSGWVQIYVETAQEAFDHLVMAYKLAENPEVLLPVMVSLDGFFVSHAFEPVDIADVDSIREFVPHEEPKYPHIDLSNPKAFNAMAFPDYFEEFQRDKHVSMLKALHRLDDIYREFRARFGREYARLETYHTEDAEVVLFGMGSMMGTTREVVERLRSKGQRVGMARIICYRPFCIREVIEAARNAKAVGVLDRDISFGSGGILYQDVIQSLHNAGLILPTVNFIVGLGGRDVTQATIEKCFEALIRVADAGYTYRHIHWPDENAQLLSTWGVGDDSDS